MGHSYNTPLQDTLVRHPLGRCLSNTPVGHFIKHLYGTSRSYFCGKQALNITVGSAPSNPPTTQIDMSHALSISLVGGSKNHQHQMVSSTATATHTDWPRPPKPHQTVSATFHAKSQTALRLLRKLDFVQATVPKYVARKKT